MNHNYGYISTDMKIHEKLQNLFPWQPPAIKGNIPQGDMPGDQAQGFGDLGPKAETIFPELARLLQETINNSQYERAVVSVCGGSGTGKTGIASLLSYYLNQAGIGSYTLSGDNYPHRIPIYNDAERLRVFRRAALHGIIDAGQYTPERFTQIKIWQEHNIDADVSYAIKNQWFKPYIESGREGLRKYLGTSKEIDFKEISSITEAFKNGADTIWLKRMGRTSSELWYDKTSFEKTNILIIEWTHGNSDYLKDVDIPIFLNSTPKETLEYRKMRGRDGNTDSPFTTMVLGIEQELLHQQAHKAKIILSKNGKLLSYKEYLELLQSEQKGGTENE